MIKHQMLLSTLAKGEIQYGSVEYKQQVASYRCLLDDLVKYRYQQYDFSDAKMSDSDYLKQLKANLAETFNQLASRIVCDVLSYSSDPHQAAAIFTFWVDVAINTVNNFELQRAIVAGLNHVNLSRIYEPGKPGYQQLNSETRKNLELLLQHKRFTKELIYQDESLPPCSLFFGALEFAEQLADQQPAKDKVLQRMRYFQNQQKINAEDVTETNILNDMAVDVKIGIKKINDIGNLDDDEVWEVSSELRENCEKINNERQQAKSRRANTKRLSSSGRFLFTPRSHQQVKKHDDAQVEAGSSQSFQSKKVTISKKEPDVVASTATINKPKSTPQLPQQIYIFALTIRGCIDVLMTILAEKQQKFDQIECLEALQGTLSQLYKDKVFKKLSKADKQHFRELAKIPDMVVIFDVSQDVTKVANAIFINLFQNRSHIKDTPEAVKQEEKEQEKPSISQLKFSPDKLDKLHRVQQSELEKEASVSVTRRASLDLSDLPSARGDDIAQVEASKDASKRHSDMSPTPKYGKEVEPKIQFFENIVENQKASVSDRKNKSREPSVIESPSAAKGTHHKKRRGFSFLPIKSTKNKKPPKQAEHSMLFHDTKPTKEPSLINEF
ncbi:RasGEF domain-containing protein [Thiotrichales bacterium 19S3-7]|nr:RasGEF domain-containing protein [Thiotrichales bacterium 19S3-7]MCF6801360.1 RasGEF domain-containing protein [Thiotrichales bacterium 19S3-11]